MEWNSIYEILIFQGKGLNPGVHIFTESDFSVTGVMIGQY